MTNRPLNQVSAQGTSSAPGSLPRAVSRVPATAPTSAGNRPLNQRVAHILNLIRPAVQSDGGDLELVDITPDGTVKIRLHGACVGCPSSQATLQLGIERNLRDHVPEIKRVEAVE